MCDMFQRLEKMLQKFLMSKPKLKLSSNIFTKTKKKKEKLYRSPEICQVAKNHR